MILRLKEVFEQDPNVNTIVSTGDPNQLDSYRQNIFPIVQVYVLNSPSEGITNGVTRYNVEVTAVDVRDMNKEDVNDKYFRNDNFHDNINLMRSVLKRAEMILRRDNNVEVVGAQAAEPIVYAKQNVLDGWSQVWTIDVVDSINYACSLIEIESYTPATVLSGGTVSSIDLTFNVVPEVGTGSFEIQDSNGNVFEDLSQANITQTAGSRTISVVTTGTNFENPPDDTYYLVIPSGLIDFRGQSWSSAFEGELIIRVS